MRLINVALLTCLLPFLGCAHDEKMGAVTGRVTLDGEPLPHAQIEFQPNAPKGSASYAVSDEDGYYKLMFNANVEGAQVGEHTIRITTERRIDHPDGRVEFVAEKLPPKYHQETELVRKVESGSNEINLELTSG